MYETADSAVKVAPAPFVPREGNMGPERILRLVEAGARARKNKDLLVYLHVPFCSSKCHFCDWVVGYNTSDLVNTGELRDRYVDALCAQIAAYGPMLAGLGYRVTNVYWGGGTPTRLSAAQMARIGETLSRNIDLSGVREHTAECSPETVTADHISALQRYGLNRVSAGAQSFDPQILRRMGRAHSAGQIDNALRIFASTGLRNHNLDLITGFPGQSRESSLDSVRRAVEAGVPHLSLYMFREFAGNLVAVKQVRSGYSSQRPREDRYGSYLEAKAFLEAAGYEEYLTGYFARGAEYRFDSEDYYFSLRGDYFGFGAGAGSVLGRCVLKSGDASRYGNSQVRSFVGDPLSMNAGPAWAMPDVLYTDGFFKAFATPAGIRFDRWNDQFGFSFETLLGKRPAIRQWFAEREEQGAVFAQDEQGIRLTEETRLDTMIWRR